MPTSTFRTTFSRKLKGKNNSVFFPFAAMGGLLKHLFTYSFKGGILHKLYRISGLLKNFQKNCKMHLT